MYAHESWLTKLALRAKSDQKSFRIVNLASGRADVDTIDISVIQDQPVESAADKTGWMVDIRYQNAPETPLFSQTYPSEEQARKIYDDLVMVVAEVEGLIKAEKFDEAKAATEALMLKLKANTGNTPVSENDTANESPL